MSSLELPKKNVLAFSFWNIFSRVIIAAAFAGCKIEVFRAICW